MVHGDKIETIFSPTPDSPLKKPNHTVHLVYDSILYIYFRLSSFIISIQIFMKTKKNHHTKNRTESWALNYGALLSQYLNGFSFLFINKRHGFLKINRMVFSLLFLHVCRMTYFLIFFCSFTETQKSRFHPEETEYETILKQMIYEKYSWFIFFILDSMFCFCCVYYFLRVSDARNENYQEIIADAYFGEFEGITYKCLFVNA